MSAGGVCQHELFCEKACLLGKKLEPVAIGSLERFCADHNRATSNGTKTEYSQPTGPKVALVGSGPASMIAAFDLVRKGYRVSVFEALHELGGVLAYGIPPFRLPREILNAEIERLAEMGVEFHRNFIVGKTATVEELFEEGYEALFIGTGAGLPYLMSIPGENLIGVYTANEFLTRINLMHAYQAGAETPVRVGRKTVVIGGGNSAMDAARWAKRMGSETTILFRRGRAELRARLEEIEHAEQEGIHFEFLAAPVAISGDEKGFRDRDDVHPDGAGGGGFEREAVAGADCGERVRDGRGHGGGGDRAGTESDAAAGDAGVADESGQDCGGRLRQDEHGGRVRRRRCGARRIDGDSGDEGRTGGGGGDSRGVPGPRGGGGAMNRILLRRQLTPEIVLLEVEAPRIAKRWKPGNFIIIRPTAESERIPLTIVAGSVERGSITMVVQAIGKTTMQTAALQEGDALHDLVGPLGEPATVENVGHVLCVGGGVGVAELLPVAGGFRQAGNYVTAICGARTAGLRILREELTSAADEVLWATDDGSAGLQGNVVEQMKAWTPARPVDMVHAIGPIPMMRAVAALTREWGVRTFASLNPVMIDGTGMCGGCRVTVGGKVRFACVEGPEFDAHQVDFEELIRRNRAYSEREKAAREAHVCRVGLG